MSDAVKIILIGAAATFTGFLIAGALATLVLLHVRGWL